MFLLSGDAANFTDLVYDGVFEVLQWILFLSAVPPVQLLTGWCVTAKHRRTSALSLLSLP